MALSTYADLLASIGTWLNRDDMATIAPDLVVMTEAEINKQLRHRKMLKRVEATLDEQFEELPSDFLEMVNVILPGSPNRPLEFVQPLTFPALSALNEGAGTPRYYTVIGSTLEFAPAAAGGLTCQMAYYAKLSALSNANTSNWLLSDAPDVYLYGALWKASAYLREDERASEFKALFDQALSALSAADTAATFSAGPLQTRVG